MFYYWRLTLSFWGIFGSSTIILLGWGGQEQAWLVLMWSSNDSLPPYFIYYIFIIYLNLALTSCRASLISFCGDEEQKEIKKTVCLTRMRACTYFIWVIWILNHHMYFAKISTSSHPHVWLLTWLCISVSCLTDCLMSDSLYSHLRSDTSQAGARWAVYSVIHSLATPPAPLCVLLYFCITARSAVCKVYLRSHILTVIYYVR